jgi:hypothetical protein
MRPESSGTEHQLPSQPTPVTANHDVPAGENLEIGTPAWGRMNQRRWHLIQKEYDDGLDDKEQAELEILQRQSLATVEKEVPEDLEEDKELAALLARLGGQAGAKRE